MTYAVKEIFYTLQGEGANAGRPAVFCRFAGCNLWSGLERDRATAVCQFCDTEFVGTGGAGGGKFETPEALADRIAGFWPGAGSARKLVVCTGGEPALQLDAPVIDALHDHDFEIAIETNGTVLLAAKLDWICVSPKAGTTLAVTRGDELKVIYPQAGIDLDALGRLAFTHHFLQPMDGPAQEAAIAETVRTCLAKPEWRLSLQTHKFLGIR